MKKVFFAALIMFGFTSIAAAQTTKKSTTATATPAFTIAPNAPEVQPATAATDTKVTPVTPVRAKRTAATRVKANKATSKAATKSE